MEREAAAVGIDGGILGNVGVVHNAVLAVGNESVDFHIVVGGEPLVQDILAVGRPQNGTVQDAAVFKGVGQVGNVHAAAIAEGVDCHLNFLVLLHQNVGALQGVDALLALAEVRLSGNVCQDEVVGVLLPVVLVVVQGEAGFLLHAQNAGQLEVVALVLVAGGLAYADEAAAPMDKLPNRCGDGGISVLVGTYDFTLPLHGCTASHMVLNLWAVNIFEFVGEDNIFPVVFPMGKNNVGAKRRQCSIKHL